MIIVEGPDGAGKTTLIRQLQERWPDLAVAPRVVSKDAEAMVDLQEWVNINLSDGPQYKIFDRHRLISEFARLTDVPVVLNTSFNENEPVVCRPEEALDCFLRTKMDVLVLGNYFVERRS